MGKLLQLILGGALSSFVGKIFVKAGITLVSSVAFYAIGKEFIDLFTASLGQWPQDVTQLLALSGFDRYLSIVLGAMLTSFMFKSNMLALSRNSGS